MKAFRGRLLVFMVISILLCLNSTSFAATAESGSQSTNKYNVVFVIDESGSMATTDKDKARYDAIDMFLSLMAREGNSVGSVTFNDAVIYEQSIKAISSKQDKETFLNNIKKHSSSEGDTDIGEALQAAVKLLDSGRNQKLPSAIILLTDGNTDLDNNPGKKTKEEAKSEEDKAKAIDEARDNEYKMFTVCLNGDGSADISETKQIASATGGESAEVKSADDLTDVYRMFYGMIYDGEIPEPQQIPDNGIVTFEVPNAGVEEANVMIYGTIKSCTITDPSGAAYTEADVSTIKNLTIEKISKPKPGKWTVKVVGDKDTKILYNLVYNYDFVVSDTTKLKKQYHEGEKLAIKAELTIGNGSKIDAENQDDFNVKAVFIDANSKVIDEKAMKAGSNGFQLSYTIPDKKSMSYYISAKYASGDKYGKVEKMTQPRLIVVSNSAPVSNGDVEETVKDWPFKHDEFVLDLTTLAKDNEDGNDLTYTIKSTAFIDKKDDPENGDYILKDNILTQDHFSLRKGSYIIRCTDSGGLYCDVKVTVNSINIGLLAMIGLGAIALIVLIALLITTYMALTRPLAGRVRVKATGMPEAESYDRGRGKLYLRMFGVQQQALQKAYIQATGKDYVILVPKTTLYLNGKSVGNQIEIKSSTMETILGLDPEGREQLAISFQSMLDRSGKKKGPHSNPISDFFSSIGGLFSGIGGGLRGGQRGRAPSPGGGRRSPIGGQSEAGGGRKSPGRAKRPTPPKGVKGRARKPESSGPRYS